MPSPIAQDPKTLLRALAAHARRRGVRQVEATADGVVVVDGVGRRLPVRLAGEEVVEAHRDIPGFLRLTDEPGRGWLRKEHEDQGELGEWDFKVRDGTLVIRPRKPTPACVDALFKSAPEGMDRVRALYGQPGVGILVRCQGEARARDMAQAIVAELAAFGAEVTLEHRTPVARHWYASHVTDEHMGLEPFDQRVRDGVAAAEVVFAAHAPSGVTTPPDDVTRVTVVPGAPHRGYAPAVDLDDVAAPLAVVDVTISPDDSAPHMVVALSPAALRLAASPLPVPDDAPWVTYRAARDGRAARPAKPRTWHQTTEQVARAYVAREATRGMVSGFALYFHGPVAYSVGDYNPVAAYLADRDGGTVVLMGRKDAGGVSRKAVVSMAQGDLTAAFGKGQRVIDLGANLDKVLRWDGLNLEDAAYRFGRAKAEHERPRTCTVDVEAMGRQFERRLADLEGEREAKRRPNFPTLGHAHAIAGVARLVRLRDEVADRLGVELPSLGDAAAVQAEADAAYRANEAHVAERARLKAERDAVRPSADEPAEGRAAAPAP